MTLSLDDAKKLTYGTILFHVTNINADGSPQRWRVNGKVKTWKRSPDRIQVPLKQGMYGFDYLTEEDLSYLTLCESDALLARNSDALGFDNN